MTPTDDRLMRLDALVRDLKGAAAALEASSADIPAVCRNVRRILASIKMLEINIADAAGIAAGSRQTAADGSEPSGQSRSP